MALVGRVVSGWAGAVRHPVSTAAYGVGLARGVVRSVGQVVTGGPTPEATTTTTTRDSAEASPEPEYVMPEPGDRIAAERAEAAAVAEAAPVTPAPEPVVTEPKATSRESAHGDAGGSEDDLIDDWAAEAEPETDEEHVPPGNPEPEPEPLDLGALKAVRSEAQTLQRAADPDKG